MKSIAWKSLVLSFLLSSMTLLGFSQQSSGKTDFTYVHLDKQAVPLNLKAVTDRVEYPADLVLAGIEGRVVYRVLVDKKGNYRKHQLVSSPDGALSYLADSHLKDLEFIPAEQNGEKVTSWVNIPVVFKISPTWAAR